MYAKIFAQIFDSSIAENYKVRHVFEDLLKLADLNGCVNMTVEAVARRSNAPLDEVSSAICQLMEPDPKSQSKEAGGRRLVPIDPQRDWGWVIVNYHHYRDLMTAEELRESWRKSKAAQRAREKTLMGKIGRKKKEKMSPVAFEKYVDQKITDRAEQLRDQHHPDGINQ